MSRILIIEDELPMRSVLTGCLERHTRVPTTLQLGEVRIDFVQQRAWRGPQPLHLTAKELGMLRLLAESAGQPVSRDRFLDIVWGYGAFPTTRTIDKHIAGLRAKIETDPDHPQWIETVHAIGYRLGGTLELQ